MTRAAGIELPPSDRPSRKTTARGAYRHEGALVHNSFSGSQWWTMSKFKRSQRKYVKKSYRVRNWRGYEAGLRARGSLTVWISLTDGKLANWDARRPSARKPGRQRKYSNHAIETAVTLGMVFHAALQTDRGIPSFVVPASEARQRCARSHHDLEA